MTGAVRVLSVIAVIAALTLSACGGSKTSIAPKDACQYQGEATREKIRACNRQELDAVLQESREETERDALRAREYREGR
jgi:hypothetical protein